MVRPMVVRRVVKYGLFVWGYDAVSDTGQWVVVISVCDVLNSAVLSLHCVCFTLPDEMGAARLFKAVRYGT